MNVTSRRWRAAVTALSFGLALAAPAAVRAADRAAGEPPAPFAFDNTTPITIGDTAASSPYPSVIAVPQLGPVFKVRVRLVGVNHPHPDDLDILLVSPSGNKVLLQTDAGGNTDVIDATYTFDQTAAGPIPDDIVPRNATGYRPSNYDTTSTFPAPAPAPPYGTSLDDFVGTISLGNWSLYVVDDDLTAGTTGVISGGWVLEISTNLGLMQIPAVGPAVPYPSNINVSGLTGTITKVRVTLQGFIHSFPDDLDIILVGPTGANVMLMSDAGGSLDLLAANVTFDQAAAVAIPDSTQISSGSYLPGNYVGGTDAFPVPAPAGPYGTTLDVFNTTAPNGTWSLYVVDDTGGDQGGINAWSLEITTTAAPAQTFNRCAFRKGDFNSDNRTDVLWRHDTTGQNLIWALDYGTLLYSSFTSPDNLADTGWKMVGTNDFNYDCKTDILWRHETSGQNVVWFMNGMALTSGTFLNPATLADTRWKIGGTGDINLDGQADLVWRHDFSGENVVWFMNGTNLVSGTFTNPSLADTNWKIVGVDDVNLDAKPDFVWHHLVSGETVVWFMNGVNLTGGGFTNPPGITDNRWRVGAVGDLNGDNRPDLIWRNQTSGDNLIWFMNGLNRISAAGLPAFPDVSWKMVGPR
jgi:subtilisin-like proprotein convertase family protein